MNENQIQYDIAFSFAGEDRDYVKEVASLLEENGIKVFYDEFEEVTLWGKDLYQHLSDIYSKRARLTVIFISQSYSRKLWTKHELKAAQSRAFQENSEYILPARFDDTEIPGLHPTIGYIDLQNYLPSKFAELIIQKLIQSGYSLPSDIIRRDYFSLNKIPTSKQKHINIIVKCDNNPIVDCLVTLVSENGTAFPSKTDAHGIATLAVPIRRLYDILIAHKSFPGSAINSFDPINDINISLLSQNNIGSQIIQSTGCLPIISGRLNPILDHLGRTYLYADNISINNGALQPVNFKINYPLELEDKNGNICLIVFKYIKANISLIQYMYRS